MISDIKFSPVKVEDRKNLNFKSGDRVRVWQRIQEGGKSRLQAFEGLVISRKHGRESGATFTVRKVSGGVGVERIFPLYSPSVEKIELVSRSKARKSKIYYVREKSAKDLRRKLKGIARLEEVLMEKEEEKPAEKGSEDAEDEAGSGKEENSE